MTRAYVCMKISEYPSPSWAYTLVPQNHNMWESDSVVACYISRLWIKGSVRDPQKFLRKTLISTGYNEEVMTEELLTAQTK